MTTWKYANDNFYIGFNWMFIIPSLHLVCILLSILTFAVRVKAKYTYTEIEDIAINDRDQKRENDLDSPAILEVFFEEMHRYEKQTRYYKKVVEDAAKPKFVSVFDTNENYPNRN